MSPAAWGRLASGAANPRAENSRSVLRCLKAAERQDAGQESRGAPERAGEFVGKRARRALCRHIDRRIGEFESAQGAGKFCDDSTVEQRTDKTFKKWRARRDGEDVFLRHDFGHSRSGATTRGAVDHSARKTV
ncbi:MAG: hypothetical protein WDN29_01805 [Methylovirgula sp.]